MNPLASDAIAQIVEKYAHTIRPKGTPQKAPSPLADMAWGLANADALAPIVLDQSPRARTLRRARRIALRHAWGMEVIRRVLDECGARSEVDLTDEGVAYLLDEVERQDGRAQTACDDDDAPPAR